MKPASMPLQSRPALEAKSIPDPWPADQAVVIKSRVNDVLLLIKPRITIMVLLTVAIGYFVAVQGKPQWLPFLHALLGISAVAASSSILNQWMERSSDRLMKRTENRPLPGGRILPWVALGWGLLLGSAGVVYLYFMVNPITAWLTAWTLVSYSMIYTPLKRVTAWNTVVGAISGAMPPLLGFAAGAGYLNWAAWSLFAILFVWQFPHFWAIAWMYREDYGRAGLWMLPNVDQEDGRFTGRWMMKTTLLLIVVSLLPAVMGLAGMIYFIGAWILGIFFLWSTHRFWQAPSYPRARQTLLASVLYLPALLLLLLANGTFWG